MLNNEAQQALNDFAKYVIQQSRSNLTKSKKTDSKDLYNSLGYSVDKTAKGVRLTFEMSDYGEFVDKGVKGKDPSKVSPNAKIKGQQAPNSPYRFGSGSKRGTFDKFARKMSKWAKRKNLRFRNKKGQFAKGGYDAMGYVVASNIYNRGIKPSLFFTKPFNKAFERLPQELLEAYAVGIEKQINVNLKEI
jgi:hypothetical protein